MKPQQETGYRIERDPIGENRLSSVEEWLLEVPLGGTAVGTGTNAKPEYMELVGAAELATKAIESGKSVKEVVAEE